MLNPNQQAALAALVKAQAKVAAAQARLAGAEQERDAALLAASDVPSAPLEEVLGVSRWWIWRRVRELQPETTS